MREAQQCVGKENIINYGICFFLFFFTAGTKAPKTLSFDCPPPTPILPLRAAPFSFEDLDVIELARQLTITGIHTHDDVVIF